MQHEQAKPIPQFQKLIFSTPKQTRPLALAAGGLSLGCSLMSICFHVRNRGTPFVSKTWYIGDTFALAMSVVIIRFGFR
jgi:hypothetical protein